MLEHIKTLGRVAEAPSVTNVVLGTLLGIVATYVAYFTGEILTGTHIPDLGFISNLLWLAVPVMFLGWYEATYSAKEK